MIKPEDIKIRASRKYKAFLQAFITQENIFPLIIPGDKKASKTTALFNQELQALISQSKEKKGYGYTVTYEQRKSKTLSKQSFPKQFSFETEQDYVKFLGKEREVSVFKINYKKAVEEFPELYPWVLKQPLKVINNRTVWDDLLKICRYFKKNPTPNLYIRQLPIKIHTKFIERNIGIARELLNHIIAENANSNVSKFEERFNLKYSEPLVRFRILDNAISNTYFQGIDDISITASKFETLKLPLTRVFIVENLMNVLTLPEQKNSIVIFGKGFQVSSLKNAKWLNNVEIIYWGDIDVQGFEILSQVRGYFKHTKSILMDETTFNTFFEDDKGTASKVQNLEHLLPNEELVYKKMQSNNWRLEQEKIPDAFVHQYFNENFD